MACLLPYPSRSSNSLAPSRVLVRRPLVHHLRDAGHQPEVRLEEAGIGGEGDREFHGHAAAREASLGAGLLLEAARGLRVQDHVVGRHPEQRGHGALERHHYEGVVEERHVAHLHGHGDLDLRDGPHRRRRGRDSGRRGARGGCRAGACARGRRPRGVSLSGRGFRAGLGVIQRVARCRREP